MNNNFTTVRFIDDFLYDDGAIHQTEEVKFSSLKLNDKGNIIIPEGTIALFAVGENNLLGFDGDYCIEVNPEEVTKHTEAYEEIFIISNKRFEEFRNNLSDVFFKSYDYFIGLRNFITNRTDTHDSFDLELYTTEHKMALDEIIRRAKLNIEDELALYYKFEHNCSNKESAENAGISVNHLKTVLTNLSLTEYTPMKYFAIGEYTQVKGDEEWVKNIFYQQHKKDSYNDHSEDILKCDVRTLYYEGVSVKDLSIIIGTGIESLKGLNDVIKRKETACCTYEDLAERLGKKVNSVSDIINSLVGVA